MPYSRTLSLEQALQKARHYCGYQERSHSEVRDKLYSFGLRKKDVETALATLIEENYLNEERFAIQFAGGHFRLKEWGKVKIRYELRQRQVSEYCIKKALAAIDEEDYGQALGRLAAKKWEILGKEGNAFVRKRKLQDYLLQKGYESDKVSAAVRTVAGSGEGD
ncbi:MAG: RecX family transcriptional regulator [Bacteroidetes bacterium]|nr:RecX family transcriptional regulator [Bacteroidota bacterium]